MNTQKSKLHTLLSRYLSSFQQAPFVEYYQMSEPYAKITFTFPVDIDDDGNMPEEDLFSLNDAIYILSEHLGVDDLPEKSFSYEDTHLHGEPAYILTVDLGEVTTKDGKVPELYKGLNAVTDILNTAYNVSNVIIKEAPFTKEDKCFLSIQKILSKGENPVIDVRGFSSQDLEKEDFETILEKQAA